MTSISEMTSALVFRLARTVGMQPWIAPLFCRVHRLLPLAYVAQTPRAIAIRHPRPGWTGHIVVTPVTPCRALLSPRETRANRGLHLWEIYALARDVAAAQPEAERGRILIINGGNRQEIGQLHGHLAPSPEAAGFASDIVERRESHDDLRRFPGITASPEGFTSWLGELEKLAPGWLDHNRGFSVIIPLLPDVLPVVDMIVERG